MLKNTSNHFGFVTKFLHWFMAVLFIGMFTVAYTMLNIPKSDFRLSLYDLHKATGLLLFSLFSLRLIWRLTNVQPQLSGVPTWQKNFAKWNVILLYFLMLAMPTTGFLTSTLGGHDITFYHIFTLSPLANHPVSSEFFSKAHELLSYFLIVAFTLHLLGALHHHLILKDGILRRMWFS